jgi:hypothetical protein
MNAAPGPAHCNTHRPFSDVARSVRAGHTRCIPIKPDEGR